ncbi:MAG TPA: adenylyl-sulfate kinase, partial [Proteobacteria bacterium]|nr:adenylyl-sulfate kinase [Pseudomonadota bacterium]
FIEIYLDCSLDACRNRDPKGLYKKADAGEIAEFTGVSAPYEPPLQPELSLKTDELSEAEAVDLIIAYLRQRQLMQI